MSRPNEDVARRFWQKVDRRGPDECWPWLGCKNGSGYGDLYIDGRTRRAHRFAYELLVGPIPSGLTLDHLCRTRHCVNPAHLEPVTNKENLMRGVSFSALNAKKTHCKRGHEFTPENTVRPRDGRRRCRTCLNDRQRAKYHARRKS